MELGNEKGEKAEMNERRSIQKQREELEERVKRALQMY